MLDIVTKGGFDLQLILSLSAPPPACLRYGGSVLALIYDDVMHFTRDPVQGSHELACLDRVYKDEAITVVPEKDQTLVKNGLACGIELHQVTSLRPNVIKLRQL